MNGFLTDNIRRAYPLEQLPAALNAYPLWTQLLSDACIATSEELADGERLSLVFFRRNSNSTITVRVGVPGVFTYDMTLTAGLGEFATVPLFLPSAKVKALFTVNGRVADAIIADAGYGTTAVTVRAPFALRCVSSAPKRVQSIAAYSAAECTTPVFTGGESAVKTVTGGDVVLGVKDGLDLEAVELMPLEGELFRLSAIAAPADTSGTDTDVDLMIRGDGCFTVDTIPGAKAVGNTIVARTASEADGQGVMGGGVIKIGNACKPCCQCDDYKVVIDALRNPETRMVAIEQLLSDAKWRYDAAVTAFNGMKTAATNAVNSYANVHCRASAAFSTGTYTGTTAIGTRARVAVTLRVENLTQETVTVMAGVGSASGTTFTVPNYKHKNTTWVHAQNGGSVSGTTMAPTVLLDPGETLTVIATYVQNSPTSAAVNPGVMYAHLAMSLPGLPLHKRTVNVT